jgi:calcium channel MID1
MHEISDVSLPLLGDTTSNQALLFSHPLAPAPPVTQPTYPNYTLPPANLSLAPDPPSVPVGMSVVITPTSSLEPGALPMTGCAMRDAAVPGMMTVDDKPNDSNGLWLKDEQGWRYQWLVSGLQAQTNYTAYVVQNSTKVVGPINFVTKSGLLSFLRV